jgi:hypothetical protein
MYGFDRAIQVCNFEQTATTSAGSLRSRDVSGHCESAMSQIDEFWQYAKEAIISASRAETEDERHGLLDLARTWTQAALVGRHLTSDHDNTAIVA